MNVYRPDRVVKTLAFIASALYFAVWAGVAMALVVIPAIEVLSGEGLKTAIFLDDIPVDLPDMPANVAPTWAPTARLTVSDVKGVLELPVAIVPRRILAMSWIINAIFAALVLLFFHHLRRLFMRVRDGVPFDAQNAVRLRWLGALFIVLSVFTSLSTWWISSVVSRPAHANVTVSSSISVEWSEIFVGLVLLALAEIFSRGTALEDEQSLVI